MSPRASRYPALSALGIAALALTLGAAGAACQHAFRFDPSADAGADTPPSRPPPCLDDTGCGLGSLHCEEASGACVECTSDPHCASAGRARCDLATNRCVECSVDADCGANRSCALTVRRCVDRCDLLTDCPTGAGECELSVGLCESCDVRADCASTPATPVCDDATRSCVACVRDLDCPADAPRCDRPRARCVSCLASDDCPASAPWCDPALAACVAR